MSNAIEWVDGYGRSHWQPRTKNGESLWNASNYSEGPYRTWRAQEDAPTAVDKYHSPVTYRSRARAERVARRREARIKARELSILHRVPKEQDS